MPRFIEMVHKTGYRLMATPNGAGAAAARPGDWAADLEAYAVYLEARTLQDTGDRSGLDSAVALYGTALRMNPRLAAAHVGLAEALVFTSTNYSMFADVARIHGHCHAALRLDGGLAEAWAVKSHACAYAGQIDEATDLMGRALAHGPGSASIFYHAARVCMAALAVRPAAAMLERAAQLAPTDPHALVLAGKMRGLLGDAPAAARNHAAALPRLDARLAEYPGDFRARAGRARCRLAVGRREEAGSDVDLARAHPEPMTWQLANTLAQNGRTEAALDALEAAIDGGWRGPWARPWLDQDTDFDALRGQPRFARLAAQVGPAA